MSGREPVVDTTDLPGEPPPYEPPTLVLIGSLRDLVAATGGGKIDGPEDATMRNRHDP
jgi:hypothetical protein